MWHACGCYDWWWEVLSQVDVYRQRGVGEVLQLITVSWKRCGQPEVLLPNECTLYSGSFIYNRTLWAHTSSSTSTRTYWRVHGWLSRWRTVVIRASLMRLSWQSSTLFRIVPRPPRLATTSGFFSAAEQITQIKIMKCRNLVSFPSRFRWLVLKSTKKIRLINWWCHCITLRRSFVSTCLCDILLDIVVFSFDCYSY